MESLNKWVRQHLVNAQSYPKGSSQTNLQQIPLCIYSIKQKIALLQLRPNNLVGLGKQVFSGN